MLNKKRNLALEILIVFLFMLALVFSLPYLASDEQSAKNPALNSAFLAVVFFIVSRILVVIRDYNQRRSVILFAGVFVEILGFWIFVVLLQDIIKMDLA